MRVVCGSLLSVPLGAFGGAAEIDQRLRVGARIDAELTLEQLGYMIDDAVVPVLAAQAHVALDGEGLEMLVRQAHEGDIEGAAAQVVHEDGTLPLRQQGGRLALPAGLRLLKRVGQGGGGRLVEDVEHVESGDAAGVLGGLAARVVKVGRHRDDGPADGTDAQLGVLDELAEDDGRQRLGAELASGHEPAQGRMPHAPLDERGDAVGLLQGHVEGGLADDGAAVIEQQHGAGREHVAIAIGQRHGLAVVIQTGDGRKGGAQIDADQLAGSASHAVSLSRGGS